MDPIFIGAAEWKQIGSALTFLITVPLFVIGFAFPMLFAKALIPSLVSSGHLPQRAEKMKPLLYIASGVSFVLFLWVLINFIQGSGVLEHIYPRRWI